MTVRQLMQVLINREPDSEVHIQYGYTVGSKRLTPVASAAGIGKEVVLVPEEDLELRVVARETDRQLAIQKAIDILKEHQ